MSAKVLATAGLMLSFHESVAMCGDGQCVHGTDNEHSALLQVREANSECPSGFTKVAGTKSHCTPTLQEPEYGFLQWYDGHCCVKDTATCVAGNGNACVTRSGWTSAWTGTKCCVEDQTDQDNVMQCVPGTSHECDQHCIPGQGHTCDHDQLEESTYVYPYGRCPTHEYVYGNYTHCVVQHYWTGSQCCLYEELTPYKCPGNHAHPCPQYAAPYCHSSTQHSCEYNDDEPNDLDGWWTGHDCCYLTPFCYTTTNANCKGTGIYNATSGLCCYGAADVSP